MAITSVADYQAAAKQYVQFTKTFAGNGFAGLKSSWDGSGLPPAAALALGNTTAGLVPAAGDTGVPTLASFSGSAYLTGVELFEASGNFAGSRTWVCDRLFHAGAFSGNTTYTLASQPSYSSRVPGGTDYTGLQIFAEVATAISTGALTVTVTYTNQSGTTGQTTGAIAVANPTFVNCLTRIPLAVGDSGVQKIESVVTSWTTGTLNVFVARLLCSVRTEVVTQAGSGSTYNTPMFFPFPVLGVREIFPGTAFVLLGRRDNNSPPVVDVRLEIASN